MGVVCIPERVTPGTSRAIFQLSRDELQDTVALLQAAVAELDSSPPQQWLSRLHVAPELQLQQLRLGHVEVAGSQKPPLAGGGGVPPAIPGGNFEGRLPSVRQPAHGVLPPGRQTGSQGSGVLSFPGASGVSSGYGGGSMQPPILGLLPMGNLEPPSTIAGANPNPRSNSSSNLNPNPNFNPNPLRGPLASGLQPQAWIQQPIGPRKASPPTNPLLPAVPRPSTNATSIPAQFLLPRPAGTASMSSAASAAPVINSHNPKAPKPPQTLQNSNSPLIPAPAGGGPVAGGGGFPLAGSGVAKIPEASSPWRSIWVTAAAEHSCDNVTAMVYGSAFEGLEGGEGHAGWMVSASKNVLNLWECRERGEAEGALQLMHSQATEYGIECMDIDNGSKLLLTACRPSESVVGIALHSLSAQSFFAYKGVLRMPSSTIPPTPRLPTSPIFCHVASLQPLGGPLRGSLAAAAGTDVLVFELSTASSISPSSSSSFSSSIPFTPPKASWRAHESPITCIHRSPFACALFTGGSEGSVRLWDLKTKPSAPVRQYLHSRFVTGVAMLDAHTMASASADGMVQLWDIRGGSNNATLKTMVPDGKPVLAMAANPQRDALAIATSKGLYAIEMVGAKGSHGSTLAPLTPLPPSGPCFDLKWNERTGELYVSNSDGTISVYGRSLGEGFQG